MRSQLKTAGAAVLIACGAGVAGLGGSGVASAETTGEVEVRSATAADGSYEVRTVRLTATAACLNAPSATWQIAWALDAEHDSGDVLIVGASPEIAGLMAGARLARGSDPITATRTIGVSKHTGNNRLDARLTVRILPDGAGPAFQDARLALSVAPVCAPAQVAGAGAVVPEVAEDIPTSGPAHLRSWMLAAFAALALGSLLHATRFTSRRRPRWR